MIEFTEDDDIAGALVKNSESNVLSLLYFTASWCGPCQTIFPLMESLWEKLKEKEEYNLIMYKIDLDSNEEFCEKCKIRSVPTFYIMNGKELLSSTTGANIEKIGEMIINTFNTYNKKLLLKEKKEYKD